MECWECSERNVASVLNGVLGVFRRGEKLARQKFYIDINHLFLKRGQGK